MKLLVASIPLLVLAACASSTDQLQTATASSLRGNLQPSEVSVFNVQRGAFEVTWEANAAGQHVNCKADDMVRRPY